MRKTGLLVCVALLLVIGSFAGCFGKDEPPEPPIVDDGTGAGNETGSGTDPDAGGNTTAPPDEDGTGGDNTTAEPEEPAKPEPVNETVEFEVAAAAGGAAGGTTLNVLNGQWASFTSTCTVTGKVHGGWLSEGGHLGILFGEEEVAGVDIDKASESPKTYELTVPPGTAGEYTFQASAEGTSGWDISCQVLITY